MNTALRIAGLGGTLLIGTFLAVMVLFADATLYGLRPYAVKDGLDRHDTGALLALAENGSVTGILTYDAWYNDRDDMTGWFLLPAPHIDSVPFAVNGILDPALSKLFGTAPRRCNGTPHPEKMIRALEPERTKSGFLGRSECRRAAMDLSAVIAASLPAVRHDDYMTHAELTAFDAARDPLRPRDAVPFWPSPFAYQRTVSLPLVWRAWPRDPADRKLEDMIAQTREMAASVSVAGQIDVRVTTQSWTPYAIEGLTPDLLPVQRGSGIVLIGGIAVQRIDVGMMCVPGAKALCDGVDFSPLMQGIAPLRDTNQLAQALGSAQPVPEQGLVLRDILREDWTIRTRLHAPTSESRRFAVTWFDARRR